MAALIRRHSFEMKEHLLGIPTPAIANLSSTTIDVASAIVICAGVKTAQNWSAHLEGHAVIREINHWRHGVFDAFAEAADGIG